MFVIHPKESYPVRKIKNDRGNWRIFDKHLREILINPESIRRKQIEDYKRAMRGI